MRHFYRYGTIVIVAILSGFSAFPSSESVAQPSKSVTGTGPLYRDQGWSSADRNWFYTIGQGSQIMPYDWFLALELNDSESLFRADNLKRFGYLPNGSAFNNPDGLPIGFVKDSDERGDWVGMTCAACHTNQFSFAGRTLQIDGAPADSDMFAFISEVQKSLLATSASMGDPKFVRFSNRVLGPNHSDIDQTTLFDTLKEFTAEFGAYVKNSTPKVPWGRARLDAFGMIFNRATAIDLDIPSNNHEPNAPVSYPFLWDTHWHNVVQWNGSAPNTITIERLARNVGEVVGVFAHTDIKKTLLPPLYFKTSAKRLNQMLIEDKLSRLRSPAWPAEWAPIDSTKAAAGAKLYAAYCMGCHSIAPRSRPISETRVTMTPIAVVGTDPTMATNAANLQSKTGVLEGVKMPIFVEPLPKSVASAELVAKIVVGAILAPPDWAVGNGALSQQQAELIKSISTGQPRIDGATGMTISAKSVLEKGATTSLLKSAADYVDKTKAGNKSLAYKARPLDGIWATAPYLHNGSVPNLYQLLLPSGQRTKQFYVGNREFDTLNVGFNIENSDGAFLLDTTLAGNSNAGHDGAAYGVDQLSDQQRWQLVEYLKTL